MHKRHNSHRWDLGAYKFLLAPFFMQRYPCFPFSRKSDSSQKIMKDVANKIRMKSSQLDKRDIFRKNSLTMWYQNVRHTMFNLQLVYTTLAPEYKNAKLLRRITGCGGKKMQELVATDDIYMHAILYAYDFFCNNIFHSPLSPLRWLRNSSTEKWTEKNYTLFERPI